MKPNGVSYTTVSTPRGEGLPPIRTVVNAVGDIQKNDKEILMNRIVFDIEAKWITKLI